MYCRIDTEAAQDTTGRQQSNNVTLINPHVRRRFRSTFFFPLKLKLFQRWKRAFFSDRFLLLLLLSNNVFIIHPSRQEQEQQEETILLVALGALLDREKFLSSCAGSRGESFFIFYRCLSNEPLVVSFFNFFSFFFFRPILPQRQITQSTCTIRSDPSHDTKDALEKRRHKKIDTHAIPARFLLLFLPHRKTTTTTTKNAQVVNTQNEWAKLPPTSGRKPFGWGERSLAVSLLLLLPLSNATDSEEDARKERKERNNNNNTQAGRCQCWIFAQTPPDADMHRRK